MLPQLWLFVILSPLALGAPVPLERATPGLTSGLHILNPNRLSIRKEMYVSHKMGLNREAKMFQHGKAIAPMGVTNITSYAFGPGNGTSANTDGSSTSEKGSRVGLPYSLSTGLPSIPDGISAEISGGSSGRASAWTSGGGLSHGETSKESRGAESDAGFGSHGSGTNIGVIGDKVERDGSGSGGTFASTSGNGVTETSTNGGNGNGNIFVSTSGNGVAEASTNGGEASAGIPDGITTTGSEGTPGNNGTTTSLNESK